MAKDFGKLAADKQIVKTKEALVKNGMEVLVVKNGAEAKEKVLQMISAGAEVMNMASVTVDSIGLAKELNESGKYNSVRSKFATMNKATQGLEMQKLGAAPEWAIGSVHAVTEKGEVVIASNTGSQLPAYAYGSSHVIWVVGAQKIVKNLDQAMKRVYEYVLPLENERAQKAYGQGSNVSKMLIVNKEIQPYRITIVIVKEKLGF